MTDRLVSQPTGGNYSAVRSPEDPNKFIVSNTVTGESYVVDPTSSYYAGVSQDIKMAVNLAMTTEISQAQGGGQTPAVDTTQTSGSTPTPPQSGPRTPAQLQSARSKAGGNQFDWGFASWSPSGWGTGGWHPGFAPNVYSGAEGLAMAQGPSQYRSWLGQQDPYSMYGTWGAGPMSAMDYWGDAMRNVRMPQYVPPTQQAPAENWGMLGEDFWKKRNVDADTYNRWYNY